MGDSDLDPAAREGRPWNAGIILGAKRPLKARDVWAIRFTLMNIREMFGFLRSERWVRVSPPSGSG